MANLKASNLVSLIAALDKNRYYDYPTRSTQTKIRIVDVKKPEGPITIKRWSLDSPNGESSAKEVKLSASMLWRLASAIKENHPMNIDRVFGGSYNTRSALEALLLHTPPFYICYPGRLEKNGLKTSVKSGHKHLMYRTDRAHIQGQIKEYEVSDMVITEFDRELTFDALELRRSCNRGNIDIEHDRRHAQIQILLISIAEKLGLQPWVAKNDQTIKYNNIELINMPSVLQSLEATTALSGYREAAKAGELIDVIWFGDDTKKIPAVIEIEQSTGVTSGLTRMNRFRKLAPELSHMNYIIAAPDELRGQVIKKCNDVQFQALKPKFLPYSAIEELYLLSRRKMVGIDSIHFINTFLEEVS